MENVAQNCCFYIYVRVIVTLMIQKAALIRRFMQFFFWGGGVAHALPLLKNVGLRSFLNYKVPDPAGDAVLRDLKINRGKITHFNKNKKNIME